MISWYEFRDMSYTANVMFTAWTRMKFRTSNMKLMQGLHNSLFLNISKLHFVGGSCPVHK
jgi:hypothetical protein